MVTCSPISFMLVIRVKYKIQTCFIIDELCFQDVHRLTSSDLKLPETSTKIIKILSLNIRHPHAKYDIHTGISSLTDNIFTVWTLEIANDIIISTNYYGRDVINLDIHKPSIRLKNVFPREMIMLSSLHCLNTSDFKWFLTSTKTYLDHVT